MIAASVLNYNGLRSDEMLSKYTICETICFIHLDISSGPIGFIQNLIQPPAK